MNKSVNEMHLLREKLSAILFYLSILLFIIAFRFTDTPLAGNWYQQFMPTGLPNFQVSDLYFLDSLVGFAVTGNSLPNDTSGYILKTTNGGDNWLLKFSDVRDFSGVKFINNTTGFVCGGYNTGAKLYKSANAGENWSELNIPGGGQIYFDDMFVLNQDTFWLIDSDPLVGGVFFTSNGGSSWTRQLFLGSQNPTSIYFYDRDTGYTAENILYKTTNSGQNWFNIPGGGFSDMFFINGTTGWKCYGPMQKTTDGGLSWVNQQLPQGGFVLFSQIVEFDNIINDTIWGVGSTIITGSGNRGLIYKTTNGGQVWGYQLPDSISINIFQYQHVDFATALTGWAYTGSRGVHTTNGGDTTWYIGIQKISDNVPEDFELGQNYPNPFNPRTVIPYKLKKSGYVKLIAYDILGKEVQRMVDNKHEAGEYEVDFMGKFTSTGVYLYSLTVDGILIDTKKMILLK